MISIPHYSPWIAARWEFGRLLERTADGMPLEEDRETLKRAKALDGLHFDMLPKAQAERVARAMEIAADGLRLELEGATDAEIRDTEFAEALATLEMRLHDVHE